MNQKMVLKTILFCLAVSLAFVAVPGTAKAITLIPPMLEFGLIKGEPTKTSIKIFNETTAPVELYTEVKNFTASGDSGQPAFDFTDAEQVGFSTWVTVQKGPITVNPGARFEVPVTINTPTDADPGGHYAAVFFTTSPPADGQVRIASKIGTLLLAQVSGDVKESGSISEFDSFSAQKGFNRLPVKFYTIFKNTGNIHLRPTGSIAITNMFGKEQAKLAFNSANGATLPSSSRRYETTWEKMSVNESTGNAWSGFWQEYANERTNFAIGRFTAKVSVTAGSANSVADNAQMTFWVFPWHILLVWFVVLVLVVLALIMGIKKYNQWIVKKSQGIK
ncbi:MAG: hypothetical protein V1668_04035 [Patescibacteria group bacterium]